MKLPILSLPDLFDDFDKQPVTIREVPRGGWSTPFADVIMLLKLALCSRASHMLEIGSFRGYTALLLAQHSSNSARVVTLDRYAEHGESYRNTPFAAKIERRVGEMGPDMFATDKSGSYDLIFVDADHRYTGVKRDTELILRLIAPQGFVVWHDYANWGFFSGENGVPEYLGELAGSGSSIARVAGTDLAIHSPQWLSHLKERARYEAAIARQVGNQAGVEAWTSESVRG